MHSRARRDFFEESKLVESHAQRQRDRKVHARERFFQLLFEEKIQQPPPAQHAQRQFRSQRRIRRL
jgi:hypothetical protein